MARYDSQIVKRWLLRICVFLLLGAMLNVAVAWLASLWVSTATTERANPTTRELSWTRRVPLDWPELELIPEGVSDGACTSASAFAASGQHADSAASAGFATIRGGEVWILAVYSSGWPARCLDRIGMFHDQWEFRGLPLPPWMSDYGVESWIRLPVAVIWPGFAINTVFYAFVLWLLFAAPFVLRRRRRIRRGLCPKCAYDLRGTPPDATACPECGATVGAPSPPTQ